MWIAVWQSFLKQSRTGRGRLNLELVMKFVAFERSMQGTGASRRLRNSGKTPGIVYGGVDQQPQLVELDHNALWHALKKEAFHASILDVVFARGFPVEVSGAVKGADEVEGGCAGLVRTAAAPRRCR